MCEAPESIDGLGAVGCLEEQQAAVLALGRKWARDVTDAIYLGVVLVP